VVVWFVFVEYLAGGRSGNILTQRRKSLLTDGAAAATM
jgi:hypothetical protein